MIFWWQTILNKKAGAKRPRVNIKLIMVNLPVRSSQNVLELIQIEKGWMAKALQERLSN